MATQHVNPSGVGAPSNYTHVVASSGGSIVFISGQIGMDAAGKIAGDTLEAQGAQVFENLKTCLASVGAILSSLANSARMTTLEPTISPNRSRCDRSMLTLSSSGSKRSRLSPT